jgi:hypothetical protein
MPEATMITGIQSILSEQTALMSQSTASTMSQAMGPVMEAMHQMALNQQALQHMVSGQQQILDQLMRGQSQNAEEFPIASDDGMDSQEEGWVQPGK